MRTLFVGSLFVAAAGLAMPAPAEAQDIRVSISWGSRPHFRATAYYGAGPYADRVYVVPSRREHYLHCEPEGPYLYCWDDPGFAHAQPLVVHVYATDPVVLHDGRGYGRAHARWHRKQAQQHAKWHRKQAHRAWKRWARTHARGRFHDPFDHRGDRVVVRLAWRR